MMLASFSNMETGSTYAAYALLLENPSACPTPILILRASMEYPEWRPRHDYLGQVGGGGDRQGTSSPPLRVGAASTEGLQLFPASACRMNFQRFNKDVKGMGHILSVGARRICTAEA